MDYKDKYIGDKKIFKFEEAERKTNGGNKVIRVFLEDKSEEEYPQAVLEKIISEEKKDLTFVTDSLGEMVVQVIIGALLEYEVKMSEVNTFLNRVQINVEQTEGLALDKLFGKNRFKTTLHDINEILLK